MKKANELKQELQTLKEERSGFLASVKDLNDKAETEKRSLSKEENEKVDDLFKKADDLEARFLELEKEIARAEKIEEALAETAKTAKRQAGPVDLGKGQADSKEKADLIKKWSLRSAMENVIARKPLEGVEAEMYQEAKEELRSSRDGIGGNIALPSWAVQLEKRTDIDQTTSAIQGTVVGGYVEALRETSIFNQVGATIYEGLTSDFKIPIIGKHSVAWATAENSAATDVGVNYTKDTLAPIRMTGYVEMSERVMLQNGEQAFRNIMAELGRASGTLIDEALFSSSDVSDAPPSIAGTSGVGTFVETGTFADTTSMMKDLTLAEQTLADQESLKGRLAYVLSTKFINQVKRAAQVSNVNPTATNWNNGFSNVNGYPTWFSVHPSSATTTADGIFGDFSKLIIGFFGGLDMMVDPYSASKNNLRTIVLHRHMDASTIQGAAFVKFTSLRA